VTRELTRTTAFIRAAKRHLKKNPLAARDLQSTLELLAADAFDPRLKTHKLKGDLAGVWACSAGRDLRVLFEFVTGKDGEAILLLTVGTHDEVY
jgi:addiction module RelE/StbE family toxin